MAVVPRVLADQVHVHHPQRHHVAAHVDLVDEGHLRDCVIGQPPLRAQLVQLLRSSRGVDRLEVGVVARAAVQWRNVLARDPVAQPDALDLRQVTSQPSSDSPEGGTGRAASCSAVRPAHTLSRVSRCHPR